MRHVVLFVEVRFCTDEINDALLGERWDAIGLYRL